MTPSQTVADVIVVGGGPAGSALALLLAWQGSHVELFEQAQFPREKPCGEGLLPSGVEVLRELGLSGAVGGQPLEGICFHVGESAVRSAFSLDATGRPRIGLGQRRRLLDRVLLETAASTPGVTVRQGAAVTGVLVEAGRVEGVEVGGEVRRARCVVAADGSRSTVCRCLGLARPLSPNRIGARIHFRRARGGPALTDVHVFMRRGYELYVTPLPDEEVTVAVLAHAPLDGGSLRLLFRRWCEAEPLLSEWLEQAEPISELLGRAPLLRDARARPLPAGLILLGDADRSVDPITAGGMSLALSSARLLARHFPAILDGSQHARRQFERRRARAVSVHRSLGAGLLALSAHPAAARAVVQLLQAWPSAMTRLVDLASLGAAR